jgi:hypothetical protein
VGLNATSTPINRYQLIWRCNELPDPSDSHELVTYIKPKINLVDQPNTGDLSPNPSPAMKGKPSRHCTLLSSQKRARERFLRFSQKICQPARRSTVRLVPEMAEDHE